jgi:hypothetical protein
MDCSHDILGLCLVSASDPAGSTFFGFAEFIGAFALLAIVFTIADEQYRFRISVSPIPLPRITFWAIGVIGFGTLAADLWVAQRWPVLYVPHLTYSLIEAVFAAGFLTIAMGWIYFAFLSPPRFSKWNAERYGHALFSYLLRGSDSELPVIASEVARSADRLIEVFADYRGSFHEQRQKQEKGEEVKPNPGNFAYDILRMIGNRKFCRHVVAASPGTAIRLFRAATEKKAYDAPLAQFAKNISAEAIQNPDSNLYHEDSGYQSGLLGDLKPFSKALYGDYSLVEGLAMTFHSSPLDIDFEIARNWTARQLEAYSRAVLTTYADRLEKGRWREHSYALHRAMGEFEHACWDLYKLDGVEDGDPDISEKLRVCVTFVKDLVELLEKYENEIEITKFKPAKELIRRDVYDRVAELMSEIIYRVAGITKPQWTCWHHQHNTVWTGFFDDFRESKTRTVIAFKLRRLIYEEIVEFDKYKDLKSFKAARYMGICLNCMGIKLPTKERRDRDTAPLQKTVLRWVKKNYLALHRSHPTVANACLMGGISFDAEKNQLVRTYASHADREPSRDVLDLL